MIKGHFSAAAVTFYLLSVCQVLLLTSSLEPPHLRAWNLNAHLLLVLRPLQPDQHPHNAHHHPLVMYQPPLFVKKNKKKKPAHTTKANAKK